MGFFYAFFISKFHKKNFMVLEKKNLLSISIIGLVLSSFLAPVFAEVESVKTNKTLYLNGDQITFSGTVDEDDKGLVTIVIRDPNDEFVRLTQAIINPDNSYQRSVTLDDKFSVHGIYNATAFIQNLTAGAVTKFEFSLDGSSVIPSISSTKKTTIEQPETKPVQDSNSIDNPVPKETPKIADFVDTTKDPQYYIDRYNNELAYKSWFDTNYPNITIEEALGLTPEPEIARNIIPGFPDPDKDPQYYIDRYNNEPIYKDWFDRNFPNQSIYEVIGVTEPKVDEVVLPTTATEESLPVAIESSTVSYSTEFSQMLLALGGLGILFGAVYGIKRKVDNNAEQIVKNKKELQFRVDHNSEQISQNRFWLKNKLMNLKKSHEPIVVIKERLAKGEISVEEYYQLLSALEK